MRAKSELRDYQQRGVTELYEHDERQGILPMGSGKTAMALTATRELLDDGIIRHATVFAPKRVAQLVWPVELGQWEHLQDTTMRVVAGSAAQRAKELASDAEIHVIGIDNIQWWCEQVGKILDPHDPIFDLLIIDESSRFKNPASKRLRALRLLRKRFRMVWELTGTPRPNGYEDQWGPLTLLTDGKLWGKSFYKWREERFMPLDYNGYRWSLRMEHRQRTIDDINSVSFTISDKDMPDLPPLVSNVTYIDLPNDVMKRYKQMENKAFTEINGRGIAAANMGVATSKLCQIAQGFVYGDGNQDVEHIHTLKSDWLVELVDNMNGAPLLVTYEFREDLSILRELFGKDLPFFGAGVSDKDAAKWERMWNKGELPLLALHPASAGHGLNLQHGGSQMAKYGFGWSAELYDQVIKRFVRPGQSALHCFLHHCLARGTVDEMKYDRVHNKMSMQDAFNQHLRRV